LGSPRSPPVRTLAARLHAQFPHRLIVAWRPPSRALLRPRSPTVRLHRFRKPVPNSACGCLVEALGGAILRGPAAPQQSPRCHARPPRANGAAAALAALGHRSFGVVLPAPPTRSCARPAAACASAGPHQRRCDHSSLLTRAVTRALAAGHWGAGSESPRSLYSESLQGGAMPRSARREAASANHRKTCVGRGRRRCRIGATSFRDSQALADQAP